MIRIALEWLSGCEGCEVALVDALDILLETIGKGEAEIVYAPLLLDREDYERADVTITTGSVRTKADEIRLKRARQRSGFLVAFGSCATFGGIHGLADAQGVGEMAIRSRDVELTNEVQPIWRLVKVDSMVPGCPPPERIIRLFLENMVRPQRSWTGRTVCEECPRERSEERRIKGLRRDLVGCDSQRCLLDQGVPCIGFATSSGCEAMCPKVNYPCHGCMGFSVEAEEQDQGIARAVSALASVLDDDAVEDALSDPVGFFMKFTYPSFNLKEERRHGDQDR